MTREEAKRNISYALQWNDKADPEALRMAIEALEQEPCEDAISRQAVQGEKERTQKGAEG